MNETGIEDGVNENEMQMIKWSTMEIKLREIYKWNTNLHVKYELML